MLDIRAPRFEPEGWPVTLLRWLVADGQRVALGQGIAEVEGAKATLELEAFAAGIVRQVVEAGAVVAPDTMLGMIEED